MIKFGMEIILTIALATPHTVCQCYVIHKTGHRDMKHLKEGATFGTSSLSEPEVHSHSIKYTSFCHLRI